MEIINSNLAIIIAFVSLVISGFSFALNLRKRKTEKLTSESQFIMNIHKELIRIEQKSDTLQNPNECLLYANDYLNALENLCFFDTKKYLSDDIIDFFKN